MRRDHQSGDSPGNHRITQGREPQGVGRIDKDTEEERTAAVQNLYLQGYTEEEIAERVGMPQQTVADLLPEIKGLHNSGNTGIFTENLFAAFLNKTLGNSFPKVYLLTSAAAGSAMAGPILHGPGQQRGGVLATSYDGMVSKCQNWDAHPTFDSPAYLHGLMCRVVGNPKPRAGYIELPALDVIRRFAGQEPVADVPVPLPRRSVPTSGPIRHARRALLG